MNNNLINLSGDITKQSLKDIAKEIIKNDTPLRTYIEIKAMEVIIKDVLENNNFRKAVKEDFLKQSEGALSKSELLGVVINTRSLEKKNTLGKEYIYSAEVTKVQQEINELELQLNYKKSFLKSRKLLEINTGIAEEISLESVAGLPAKETDVLDSFNITLTFK